MVFVLCGYIVGDLVLRAPFDRNSLEGLDFALLFALYLVINLIRYLVLLVSWPLLRLCGTKLNWREFIMLGYAGLRGPTGITLSLFVFTY